MQDNGFDSSSNTTFIRSVLADNVRRRANSLGMPLNSVADLAGVSRSQFYNVLRLNSSPSIDWVAKVADVLRMPLAALLAPVPQQAGPFMAPSAPLPPGMWNTPPGHYYST